MPLCMEPTITPPAPQLGTDTRKVYANAGIRRSTTWIPMLFTPLEQR
jgi:hypothetical protein